MSLDTEPVYFFWQKEMVELPESISFFGFSISLYGICLMLAGAVGVWLTIREAKKRNHNAEEYLTVLCLVFLFGGIGARVFYVLFHCDFFEKNLLWVLDLRTGGLSFYGALFGAWFSVREYCRRTGTEFATVTDSLCVAASVAEVLVWFGCFLQKEPFGKYYSGPVSIGVRTDTLYLHMPSLPEKGLAANTLARDGAAVTFMHPVAVYGLLSGLVLLLVLQIAKHRIKTDGTLFLIYLFLNAAQNLVLALLSLGSCNFFGIRLPMVEIFSVVLMVSILAHPVLKKRSKSLII